MQPRRWTLAVVALTLAVLCSAGQWELKVQPLSGIVDDCCCEVESVDEYNTAELHDLLTAITETTFFKYFKVNYHRECPFWAENVLCGLTEGGGCGVCECDPDEIPGAWRAEQLDVVDETVPNELSDWTEGDDDVWIYQDDDQDMVYLNLERNPERYTGYGGYNATRIWRAIYMENCFHPKDADVGLCFEERVFFRLISGFHASTTAHIAEHYFANDEWQPNVELFVQGLGAWPDRMKNIYFNFVFLMRAVKKASDQLEAFDFDTGSVEDDAKAHQLVRDLLQHKLLCSPTFDESQMFSNPESALLRDDFRAKFRNISEIMDCVTCETCKIHAKLQILGIGTALKILFAKEPPSLQRNEVIALLNTMHKFSDSIRIIANMRARLEGGDVPDSNPTRTDVSLQSILHQRSHRMHDMSSSSSAVHNSDGDVGPNSRHPEHQSASEGKDEDAKTQSVAPMTVFGVPALPVVLGCMVVVAVFMALLSRGESPAAPSPAAGTTSSAAATMGSSALRSSGGNSGVRRRKPSKI